MAINHDTTTEKHIITQHNNLIQGRLMAVTYCGWTFIGSKMEGAYGLGDWWKNPEIAPHMCPGCVHIAGCEHPDAERCDECVRIAEIEKHPLHRVG